MTRSDAHDAFGVESRRTRRPILLAALVALAIGGAIGGAATADDPAVTIVPGSALGLVPHGGAAGGDALYCNNCDAIGFRNLQGGGPGGQNFDVGAGSTADPGDLVFNYDVGRRTLIYDGHKHLLAEFGPKGIRFYRQPLGWPRRRWPW